MRKSPSPHQQVRRVGKGAGLGVLLYSCIDLTQLRQQVPHVVVIAQLFKTGERALRLLSLHPALRGALEIAGRLQNLGLEPHRPLRLAGCAKQGRRLLVLARLEVVLGRIGLVANLFGGFGRTGPVLEAHVGFE